MLKRQKSIIPRTWNVYLLCPTLCICINNILMKSVQLHRPVKYFREPGVVLFLQAFTLILHYACNSTLSHLLDTR